MLIEIHMLKNYPATNLNRDDTGMPKNCIFGGIQRGRISSQCLKRSWRMSPLFQKDMAGHLGTRTRKMPQMVSEKLREMGIDEEYLPVVQKKLNGLFNSDGNENEKGITDQVVFYSLEDIDAIVNAVKSEIDQCGSLKKFETEFSQKKKGNKKEKGEGIKRIEKTLEKLRPITLDIALWGRMVTSDAFQNVEASMQVAHAFSTNKVLMETDFFTAMDDMIDGNEELGSGMMGEVDYNSSCYYIYASLDTEKLRENLRHSEHPEEIVKAAVPSLIRTMAFTNPGGKQNTFAGHALPSAVLVECKDDPIPVSYANAFVEPARARSDKDLVMDSIGKLAEQVKKTTREFPSLGARKRVWFCTGEKVKLEVDGSVSVPNFDALVQEVLAVAEK